MWLPFGKRRRLTLGEQGERAAAKYLRREGFRILASNAVFGRYEIDLIAQEGDTIAFVEVKTRRSDGFADPEANVTLEKRKRICRAARQYVAQHDDPTMYYRFDVVSVLMPEQGKPAITLHRDAFRDEIRR